MLRRSLQTLLPAAALVAGLAMALPAQAAPSVAPIGSAASAALAATGDGASAQPVCSFYRHGRRYYRPGPCYRGPRGRRY